MSDHMAQGPPAEPAERADREFMRAEAGPRPIRLANGLTVYGLSQDDTLNVYRDIFDEDCYRRHGIAIEDGDCVLDVGANTGLFTLYLNTLCRRARVFAFEPVPAIFRVLRLNVAAHNHLDVRLFNVGLSRRAGSAAFAYYPHFSQASTMYPDRSARAARMERDFILGQIHTLPMPLRLLASLCPARLKVAIAEGVRRYYLLRRTVTCRLWTLSEFLREYDVRRIDLLKIDAEQSERDILAGLAEEDWPKVRQVIVEVHDGEEATRAMAESLRQRGFQVTVGPNPAMSGLFLVYGVRTAHAERG
jgi:FkbM family methyltransferase